MSDLTRDIIERARKLDTLRKRRLCEEMSASAKKVSISPLTVDPGCKAMLPEYLARTHCVVGIGFDEEMPVISMADPNDLRAMEDVLRKHPVCRIVASPRDHVERTINELYW